MSETRFVRLSETNENEGETWNFWLQVDGNEDELSKLHNILADVYPEDDEDNDYHLDATDDAIPEHEVDVLVKWADIGYMAAHNKVTGRLTCPDDLADDIDRLYKGQITDFFTQETADA